MARNYVKKPMLHHKKRRNFKHLLWLFGGFVFGYFIGSWYDFTHLRAWCWQQWKIYHDPVVQVKSSDKHASIPQPKFEFYTLLTNEHGQKVVPVTSPPANHTSTVATNAQVSAPQVAKTAVLSSAKAVVATNTVAHPSVPTINERFVVQVASFQQLREAERLKVALLMKGFDVSISEVKQNNLFWYRVNMGPFTSKQDAQKAQLSFAQRQHVMGMIRKI